MKDILHRISDRNEPLFLFGLLCFLMALAFAGLSARTTQQVNGAIAWFKPIKFALSIGIYSWTMAWLTVYLPTFNHARFAWATIGLLGFEIVYIALQAARGQASHFNVSTPAYQFLYGLMAAAATAVSLYTAYIGYLFVTNSFPQLAPHYLLGIRLGLVLFVIFSLQGFLMGSRLAHTVGGPDDGPALPFLNWSVTHGDLRVAHFIGMHALQLLPLASVLLLRSRVLVGVVGLLYATLAVLVLVLALQGKSILKIRNHEKSIWVGR